MTYGFSKNQVALAAVAAIGAAAAVCATGPAVAAKIAGQYVAGDFHNHTTCSDGSISMQKLVRKSTDSSGRPWNGSAADTPWGLDWFVQAGHGGNGNRNCTLPEDAALATPVYPLPSGTAPANGFPPPATSYPYTTWQNSSPPVSPKGTVSGSPPNQNMWRWQSIQEFQYPLLEYLSANKTLPLFLGIESVVAGHEHSSMSVITGQMPSAIDSMGSTWAAAVGNATALAQWEYCFDRADTDQSRGNATVGTVFVNGGNNWNCSVTGSLNSDDPNWNATAQKLTGNNGNAGHGKTLEALKWMKEHHAQGSYYVPAHLERAGPFNTAGANGYNVEHLRDFNNTAPAIAFGFETQPGHGAADIRGEYTLRRNAFGSTNVDTVGGTTHGGTGIYGAQVGGVWDALLGEGRAWWFFASSDWHNRGSFGADDRRSTFDFFPGEYQRNYTMVRNGGDRLRPQTIVDGLRTGNNWVAGGQLIDRLAFVACASYPGPASRSNVAVEALAVNAALNNTDIDVAGCATMGEKLKVRPGADIVVSIVVHDPDGSNFSPYSFPNPSLLQVGINRPINAPVLDHVDVIRGLVSGYKTPGAADYSGEWPRNWLVIDATNRTVTPIGLGAVPAAAKNSTAAVLKTFNSATWTTVNGNAEFKKMTFRIAAVKDSQYVRLRGTNMPANVPWETDADGNPLPDQYTNPRALSPTTSGGTDGFAANAFLKIPCTTVGTNVPAAPAPGQPWPLWTQAMGLIDGCPNHLPVVNGQKMVAYDVAAWSDLWFYANPIFVEVGSSTVVAGVK